MSGTELGQLIGIRHKEIYEIEHGRGITLTTAMRLAKALGVPIEKLWEFREQNEPSKSAAADQCQFINSVSNLTGLCLRRD